MMKNVVGRIDLTPERFRWVPGQLFDSCFNCTRRFRLQIVFRQLPLNGIGR